MFNPLFLIPNLLGWWQKKQELRLRWYELIFAIVKEILAFIIARWRIILVVAMVLYSLTKIIGLVREKAHWQALYQKEAAAHADFRQKTQEFAQKQAELVKNKQKESVAYLNSKELASAHLLAKLDLDRELTKLKLKAQYEKTATEKMANARMYHNLNQRMSIDQARIDSASTMRQEPANSERLAEIWRECNTAAFGLLEQACALTTIDYNRCRDALDADTLACGRHE